MFLIFGFRRRYAQLALLAMLCTNGHSAAHRVVKRTLWFTLFFIPVLPVNIKYASVCTQCGESTNLSKQDAMDAAQRVQSQRADRECSATPASFHVGAGAAAGWFPDPAGSGTVRWWDGTSWSEQVHPASG